MAFHENYWQTQDAKAHFSEVVKKAIHEGDQFITNRGEEVVVIISKARYETLLTNDKSLVDFFRSAPYPNIDLDIKRSQDLPRDFEI